MRRERTAHTRATRPASASAGVFASYQISIPNYANTSFRKAIQCQDGFADSGGYGWVFSRTCMWENTAAVSRVAVYVPGGANLAAGSRMTIFGLN